MTRVLEVTWEGGCNNGAVKRSHALAEPGSAAFAHRARVWLDEDGAARGAWWDDGRPLGLHSPPGPEPTEGRWVRFPTRGIPAALWALAQERGTEVEIEERRKRAA